MSKGQFFSFFYNLELQMQRWIYAVLFYYNQFSPTSIPSLLSCFFACKTVSMHLSQTQNYHFPKLGHFVCS